MIRIIDKALCVGCAACESVCPKNCIEMIKDSEGFSYPKVNSDSCLNCGICRQVCPMLQEQKQLQLVNVAGCTSTDEVTLWASSSGGLFSLLVKQFFRLHPDAHVYGAAFMDDFSVRHIRIDSVADISALCESKYVESDVTGIYGEIKALLEGGEYVYFSGTPCQVAALKEYLKKSYDNLFAQAILCHGVPSPDLWKMFVDELRGMHAAPIKQIHFRDKKISWEKYRFSVVFEDGFELIPEGDQKWYLNAFGANLSLRPACYQCHFKFPNYSADITIGDFWNVKQYCPPAYNERGVSLAIITTEKRYGPF